MQKASRQQTANYQTRIIKELEKTPDQYNTFTPFEDSIIRRFYATKGSRAIADRIKKKIIQVRRRAGELGVKSSRIRRQP